MLVNISFLYFNKSDNKFWILSVPLWTILIFSFVSWRIADDNQIQLLESNYWNTPENSNDYNKWTEIMAAKKESRGHNNILINVITLQTFVTFIFQIIGQKKTTLKIYRWTKPIFRLLFILVILLILLMGIVPTPGYVT